MRSTITAGFFYSTLITFTSGCLFKRAPNNTPSYNYVGVTGSLNWHHLSTEYEICGSGSYQSPVDIRRELTTVFTPLDPGEVTVSYPDAQLESVVFRNGHTIEMTPPPLANPIEEEKWQSVFQNNTHQMLQFHMHYPSEHTIEGRLYPMEIHFVHQNIIDSSISVLGLFLKNCQQSSEIIGALPFDKLLEADDKDHHASFPTQQLKAHVENGKIWHYMGSLTTPPCTEGVKWYFVEEPLCINKRQFEQASAQLKYNARVLQNTPGEPNILMVASGKVITVPPTMDGIESNIMSRVNRAKFKR